MAGTCTPMALVIALASMVLFSCADDAKMSAKSINAVPPCKCLEPLHYQLVDGQFDVLVERSYTFGHNWRSDTVARGTATLSGHQLVVDLSRDADVIWNFTLTKSEEQDAEHHSHHNRNCDRPGRSWLDWLFPVAWACSCASNTQDAYLTTMTNPETIPETMVEFIDPQFATSLDYQRRAFEDPPTTNNIDANLVTVAVTERGHRYGDDQLTIMLQRTISTDEQ